MPLDRAHMPGPKPRPVIERFWENVPRGLGEDECWPWQGTLRPDGYGVLGVGTNKDPGNVRAHRLSYEFANGPIPSGLVVRHRCDNPPCVNPAHLLMGTQGENVADMVSRKRQRYLARPTCGNGHPWTAETTKYARTNTRRICLICHPKAAKYAS